MAADPVNLFDYEALAAERFSPMALDYFRGGAGDEITLKENRAAFERLRLLPRVLLDVSQRNLHTTVLGTPVAFPAVVAPTAFHRLAHPDGEVATARAAAETGVIMTLSSLATASIEVVAAATSGLFWFQLYVYRDREVTRELVRRAEAAGARLLVLTVDAPLLGRRERDVRNQFALPPGLTVVNLTEAGLGAVSAPAAESGLAAYFTSRLDASVTWRDLDWMRGITRLLRREGDTQTG
jgi:4-hydroxymandelate oxidase